MKPLEIVNQYLDIVFSKNGEGLSTILKEDFIFHDPFVVEVTSAADFISKCKGWMEMPKTIKMEKQFADGNLTCSLYSVELMTPFGTKASFQLTDFIEVNEHQIVSERVYFFDPVAFAKAMGFMQDYMKKYS